MALNALRLDASFVSVCDGSELVGLLVSIILAVGDAFDFQICEQQSRARRSKEFLEYASRRERTPATKTTSMEPATLRIITESSILILSTTGSQDQSSSQILHGLAASHKCSTVVHQNDDRCGHMIRFIQYQKGPTNPWVL